MWETGPPEVEEQSHVYRATFPPQEHKLEHEGWDPATRKGFRIRVDDDQGIVTLSRSTSPAISSTTESGL